MISSILLVISPVCSTLRKLGPALRIGQLHQPIFDRTGGALTPRRHIVPQVPVLEGKSEVHFERRALSEHADTALGAAFEPCELALVALRMDMSLTAIAL